MRKIFFAIFLFMFAAALPAYAKSDDTIKLNVGGDVQAVSRNLEIEGEHGIEVEIEEEHGALQVKTEGNSSASSSVSARGKEDSSGNTDDESDDSNASIGSVIRLEAREVRGWDSDEKEQFLTSLKTALEVKTDAELEHFAQGVLLKNEHFSEVDFSNDLVEVKYKKPAKFLGFINAGITSTVSVSGDSQVKIVFPWYRFLFKVSDDSATIQQSFQARLAAITSLEGSATQRAIFLESLSEILNASASPSLQTPPTSDTSGNPPTSSQGTSIASYTMAQVSAHSSAASCWTTVDGHVYDLTSWIGKHPGGEAAIKGICGIDGTQAFTNQHGGQGKPEQQLNTFLIGELKVQ